MKYSGILGAIAEMSDIAKELNIPAEEAAAIQRERSAERQRQHEAEQAPPTNVIQFRPRGT